MSSTSLLHVRDEFGDATELHVNDMQRARSLARTLDGATVALMRGHGFVAAGASVVTTVRMVIYMAMNARVLLAARALGEITYLSRGEIAVRSDFDPNSPAIQRSWRYWATRAGCMDMLAAADNG